MRTLLALFLSLVAFARVDAALVTYTLTITNAPIPGATTNLTVNSSTRYWTNTSSATAILTNTTTTAHSATNLFFNFARYPITGVSVYMTGTNVVVFRGLDITLTQGGTWASVATSSLASTNINALMIPFDNMPLTIRTNQATEIFDALVAYVPGFTNGSPPSATSVIMANSVWVSKDGNDAAGEREDLALPFLTLEAAMTNATSGDTVYVFPGTYAPAEQLLKNGVNWHFFSGTIVTNTSDAHGIFDDATVGAVTCSITGDGIFTDSGNYELLSINNTNSVINIHCRRMYGDNGMIYIANGTVTLEADEILCVGHNAVTIFNTTPVVTINRTRIKTTSSNALARSVYIGAANNELTLRDCVLVTGPSGTYSISSTAAANVRLYGSTMANVTNHANVTFITGSTRFEVDTDVR